MVIMSAISRSVARGDLSCAQHLLAQAPYARSLLGISNGKPFLLDPPGFDAAFCSLKLSLLEKDVEKSSRKGKPHFSQAMQQKMSLWSKAQPKYVLGALIGPDGSLYCDPADISAGLSSHWASTFSWKHTNGEVQRVLAKFVHKFPSFQIPSRHHIQASILRAKNNAPGIDGIPSSAIRAAGDVSVDMSYNMLLWLLSGAPVGSEWLSALVVYPPKKVMSSEERIDRRPQDVRPISLKSTCNKVVMSSFAYVLRDPLARWTSSGQRGFVPGRSLTHNILLADSACREAGCEPASSRPIAVGLDLAAAFPSVSRDWILKVCSFAGFRAVSPN